MYLRKKYHDNAVVYPNVFSFVRETSEIWFEFNNRFFIISRWALRASISEIVAFFLLLRLLEPQNLRCRTDQLQSGLIPAAGGLATGTLAGVSGFVRCCSLKTRFFPALWIFMVSVSISAQNTFGDACFVISQKVDFTDEERIFCMSNIMHVHTFIYSFMPNLLFIHVQSSFIFLPARARGAVLWF